jgi:3-oxoacyl-[acyl-carrier protein] reductase
MSNPGASKYQNTVIVVTGARKGIGMAIAEYFLSQGAKVIGLSRGQASIQDENYTHFSVDVGKAKEVQDIFFKISKSFEHIDIVINNAAVLTSQYSLIMPAASAQAMVDTNLLGTFYVSREAAKIMKKKKKGRIINIGSMAASLEPIGDSIYAACKAGVSILANVMSKEFSSFNITCNTLGITAIETDMLLQISDKGKVDAIIKNLPVPRYAEQDDIFNVIDFFASDRSSYITAQTIYLGGVN